MIWNYVILGDQNRKTKPLGVAIHRKGKFPKVKATYQAGTNVLDTLFDEKRHTFEVNIPDEEGGYKRVTKSINDEDYLEFAIVKANLPVYVQLRGRWDTDDTEGLNVLNYLEEKFLQ